MAVQEGEETFGQRIERIETLLHQLRAAGDPAVQASAEELVEILLDLHGAGLERMLDIVWEAGEAGERIIHEALPEDDLVSSLLVLHGLHPMPLGARVQQALETVRPYMHSHGGDVEVLDIRDGVVRLRLEGSCESCQASTVTLKYAVEDAIYEAAPEIVDVEAVGLPDDEADEAGDGSFIPLEQVSTNGSHTPSPDRPGEEGTWYEVDGLAALNERAVHERQVAGRSVLFLRIGGILYAYGNTCPGCHRSLDTAQIDRTVLTCPHCAQAFDVVRAGRGLDTDADVHLDPVPLLEDEGRVKIALPAGA